MRKLIIAILLLLSVSVNAQLTGIVSSSGNNSTGSTAQNLIKYSEVLGDELFWTVNSVSVVDNQEVDLEGNTTLEELTTTGTGHSIYYRDANGSPQYITVSSSTEYEFSFDVIRGTMTDLKWSVYDRSNNANIVAPTSYYSQTSTSVQRVTFSFTTPSNCTLVSVYPIRDSGVTGTVYVGRVQVSLPGKDYVTTTTSIVE